MFTQKQKEKLYSTHTIPDHLQEYCRMLADSNTLTANQRTIASYILKKNKNQLKDKYIVDDKIVTLPKKAKLYRKNFGEGKWTKTTKANGKIKY